MKKKYVAPKLTPIGDMVKNTLGASGPDADAGGQSYDDGNPWNDSNRSSKSTQDFNSGWGGK